MSAQELPANPPPAPTRLQRSAGRHLTVAGVTPDGRQLRLGDAVGTEFTVDIDARLRAALGGESRRPDRPVPQTSGKVESKMESMLRPRDIQARIRAGETPEQVAAAAKTTVEKVMPYAAPVLAEREHVAERAQRSSIRRPAGEAPGGARTLGEAITGHLHSRNVDPGLVTWDSWRREDGRWALTGRYSIQGHEGMAELTFDQPGNFVVLDNDDAHWLVGDVADVPEPVVEAEPPPAVRRLSAVPEEQLTLGDDVLGIIDESAPERAESTLDLTDTAASVRDGLQTDQPLEAFLDEQSLDGELGRQESELVEEAADAAALDEDPPLDDRADDEADDHEPPRRAVKKTRGRASVPSWDEIMFGGKPE
jgi:DUF3071 family protein